MKIRNRKWSPGAIRGASRKGRELLSWWFVEHLGSTGWILGMIVRDEERDPRLRALADDPVAHDPIAPAIDVGRPSEHPGTPREFCFMHKGSPSKLTRTFVHPPGRERDVLSTIARVARAADWHVDWLDNDYLTAHKYLRVPEDYRRGGGVAHLTVYLSHDDAPWGRLNLSM